MLFPFFCLIPPFPLYFFVISFPLPLSPLFYSIPSITPSLLYKPFQPTYFNRPLFSFVGALNLIHLAERASYRLLDLYRDAGKIEKMASEYKRAAGAFREISDLASTHFAMGTFYSVLYLGLGNATLHCIVLCHVVSHHSLPCHAHVIILMHLSIT